MKSAAQDQREPHNSVTPFRAWYEKNPLTLRIPTREEAESRV